MPTQLNCSACGRTINVRDGFAGSKVRCIFCGNIMDLPRAGAAEPAPRADAGGIEGPAPARAACPYCHAEIAPGLSACPYCNENLARHVAPAAAPGPKPAPRRTGMTSCPYCESAISASAMTCPCCKESLENAPPPEQRPAPRVHRPAAPRVYVPWEETGRNVFARWWSTWKGSQFEPDAFFAQVPWSGGFGAPLNYVMFFCVQVLMLLCACGGPILLILLAGAPSGRAGAPEAGIIVGLAVAYIIGIFVFMAVGTFISAALYHVCAAMLGGKGSYEATYRAVCYAWGSAVWGLIPYIGGLIQLPFHIISLGFALSHAHGITKGKGILAVILPFLVCCGGAVLLYAGLFAAMAGSGRLK